MNVHNFKRVMKAIAEAPEWQTEMTLWHRPKPCGTAHCIAGWCQVLSGGPEYGYDAARVAQQFLGITMDQRCDLFHLGMWPPKFKIQYQTEPKAATLARLRHFIETEGRE